MLIMEPITAMRLSAGSFYPTSSQGLSQSGIFSVAWNKFQRSADASCMRYSSYAKNRIRASSEEQSGAGSSPLKPHPKPSRYHPSEELAEPELMEGGEARLTPAEITRTIIELNSKATVMFVSFVGDEIDEDVFWPDVPYVVDEHGNIYFQVKKDEDILQTLAAEESCVQVMMGLDTSLLSKVDVSGPTATTFGIDKLDDEDDDVDDDDDDEDDEEWISSLEDNKDEEDDDESPRNWSISEAMYFAKTLAEVVTESPLDDCMGGPCSELTLEGILRPANHPVIQKHISNHNSGTIDLDQTGIRDNDKVEHLYQDSSISAEELEKGESLGNGTSFYKLEIIKIHLVPSDGRQTVVQVEDFSKAKPDAIAHSAVNIISRLKAGGEKTTQALKSLCWRCKGIQVEEASIIGLDALGFDLKISSGMQLQTLRFTFNARASSEYSAERQLNDLLFPKTHHNPQNKREARQAEL